MFKYMSKYLTDLYAQEEIKVLTKIEEEQKIWLELGFENVGNRGNYAVMVRRENK